ncbi:HEAT repeat-containing protein 6-like [Anopheles albimanus]|uniref:HEAT repeat-containing protein 6-like n=1 Tax=Anopheles albimanus TaxID=7167 RepID=UPI0016410FFF|nr:HEAT repeat-containing protein 6-like [Anopheles albimanus]
MAEEQKFVQLSTKFLFLNGGAQQPSSQGYRKEINTLLNELNGLNYSAIRICDVRAVVRLLESLVNIPPAEDSLVVKACFLLKSLVQRQRVVLPEGLAHGLIGWLRKCLERCFYQVAYEVLGTMQIILRQAGNVSQFYDFLISSNGVLVNLLIDPDYRRSAESKQPSEQEQQQVDQCSRSELYLAAMLCIESVLRRIEKPCDESSQPYLPVVGDAVLNLMFTANAEAFTEQAFYRLTKSAFTCLSMIVTLDELGEWKTAQLGRLIGVAKAYMMYGIPGVTTHIPQRIHVSQQGIPEPQQMPISKGGKIARTRKTRTHPKGKKGGSSSAGAVAVTRDKQQTPLDGATGNRQPYSEASIVLDWSSQERPSDGSVYLTSDSEQSENENSSNSRGHTLELHRNARIRHAALLLIGTLAQHIEKRIMFGYWHALFPDQNRTAATVTLLNCALRDPAPNCRVAAIQATAFLLYRSKPFLVQAESSKKPLMSFTPFSVTLGNMVIELYAMLTQALTQEANVTVLIQLLKCLTVLIQATPFHRLRPGLAREFVTIVQQLVLQRDPNIRVSALMVMGFVISVPDMTEEIAELLGIERVEPIPCGNEARSKPIIKALHLQQAGPEEAEEEEAYDSESEDKPVTTEKAPQEEEEPQQAVAMGSVSWLLPVVLESLGVGAPQSPIMAVRMECLQVLCAMSSHYSLLRNHLKPVAQALRNAFVDPVIEVKIVAARVVDLLGHAVNTSLLSMDTVDPEELAKAMHFWDAITPLLMDEIQDVYLFSTMRSICCDALGNIGVHVFEKLPRDRQLALVSMLTGCTFDDDSIVAAAAARSLSVYILFPSLRDDACFVENTIEAILRVLRDPSQNARIKTSWSLGNVTDALILNQQQHHHQQQQQQQQILSSGDSEKPCEPDLGYHTVIGDALLQKILEAALESARDNDKVRSNAVRTIGNVLRLLRPHHFEPAAGWSSLAQSAIDQLVQNVTAGGAVNVKVKWNACYALGNMQRNEAFFTGAVVSQTGWQKRVFPALCEVVVNSPNFKVRINAAQALTVAERRSHYGGQYFHTIWTALLQALEQSDNLQDYNEYKRRDTLQEQLCLSLAHCLRLATREDVGPMAAVLLPLYDVVRQNWVRVINRILPEKGDVLFESYLLLLEQRKRQTTAGAGGDSQPPDSSWKLLIQCFECGGDLRADLKEE